MKNSMKIIITNLDLIDIKNDKTGEVKTFTRIGYLIPKEETKRSKGLVSFQSYTNEKFFDELDKFILKPVDCDYTTVVDKNRFKVRLTKIADVVLS